MKKTAIVLMSLIFLNGVCFGAVNSGTAKMTKSSLATIPQIAEGAIDSIIPADPGKKSRAQISLKQENGNIENFLLGKTEVYDLDAKRVKLSLLKAGEKAKIQYFTTKDGLRKAQSITLVR